MDPHVLNLRPGRRPVTGTIKAGRTPGGRAVARAWQSRVTSALLDVALRGGGRRSAQVLADEVRRLQRELTARTPEGELTSAVRKAFGHVVRQREANPGRPQDGPYPATVAEVAGEIAELVRELEASSAVGLVDAVLEQLAVGVGDFDCCLGAEQDSVAPTTDSRSTTTEESTP